MRSARLLAIVLLAVAAAVEAQDTGSTWTANIADVRAAARLIPGARPLRINVAKFAESRRTKNFSIKGAPAEPSIQARTAFQVVYPDGTVMVDAGMDQQVHRFFGRGVDEPYFPDVAAQVAGAVQRARLIVLTHEHGDHVGGIIRSPMAAELARKTILTERQRLSLSTRPQMPEIAVDADLAQRFIVVDYRQYLPVAPGIVLIAAPGHTPGSQMVYVVLQSGREYLLIGDVAWHMDGVRRVVGKDAPWVTETEPLVSAELRWLNELSRAEPGVVIVASHDEEQRVDLVAKKVLGGTLE
jgi:glyoxylase-like metal-dependent hydrolase (beta-lactamase superfamily II)